MSKNIDISLIGDWSSNETKKLVSTKTDQEYKNKSFIHVPELQKGLIMLWMCSE